MCVLMNAAWGECSLSSCLGRASMVWTGLPVYCTLYHTVGFWLHIRHLHRSQKILALCLSLRKLRHIGSFIPVLGKGVSIFHVPANKLVGKSVLFEVGGKVEVCSAQCSSC